MRIFRKSESVRLDLGQGLDFEIKPISDGVTCLWCHGNLVAVLLLFEDEVEGVMEKMQSLVGGLPLRSLENEALESRLGRQAGVEGYNLNQIPWQITVEKYSDRTWAVYVNGELLVVTLYRKGAMQVKELLEVMVGEMAAQVKTSEALHEHAPV